MQDARENAPISVLLTSVEGVVDGAVPGIGGFADPADVVPVEGVSAQGVALPQTVCQHTLQATLQQHMQTRHSK